MKIRFILIFILFLTGYSFSQEKAIVQWEYTTLVAKSSVTSKLYCKNILEELNKLGKEGWELIATDNKNIFYLKRRLIPGK